MAISAFLSLVLLVGSLGPTTNVIGAASWYTVGPGYYAAAGPKLRVGNWRGRIVQVCALARFVSVCTHKTIPVRLVDWCQCYYKTKNERVIDLSAGAFHAMGWPLSKGIGKVKISWST